MIRPIAFIIAFAVICAIAAWLVGERGRLILPATRQTFREQGVWRIFRLQTWHFYVYGCWPRLYIATLIHVLFPAFARLGRLGPAWLADRYHGKVLTRDHARSIVTVEREIPLRDLDRIVPYSTARQLLLQSPLEMAVYECPCRLARASHCEPTQVCMIIGQPFVDLVIDHHPHTSRRLSRAEAVELLEAEHRRGHIHIAWFKDACLDRFFAICNCCKCCCGGIDAMVHHGIPMVTSSGYVARSDPESCLGCGNCREACAFGAIEVNVTAAIDSDKCMGCGVCLDHCPEQAIVLEQDPGRGVPLNVPELVR